MNWSRGCRLLPSHGGVVPELGIAIFDDFVINSSFWKLFEEV
jgi:hypothetical protein